jgi:hypothetical protein
MPRHLRNLRILSPQTGLEYPNFPYLTPRVSEYRYETRYETNNLV